jgi:DNA segregation ATPase FtsK/SpoIIIE-like protein
MTLAWVITPTETGCRAEMEMTGRSGAVTPVTLFSDGQIVSLKFAKEDLPARAFLPIRIDRARFSNLMLRTEDGSGELVLSDETLAAMRKGSALGIAWLADEPLTAPLAGSEQGVADLRVCGAQTALQHRERLAAEAASKERAEADARAKALNEAQLAAVQAQAAAAEAQRRQIEDAARQQRQVDAQAQARADEEAQRQAYEDQRRRAYERQQQDVYDDDYEDAPRWQPPPPPRPYYPPRWSYPRY